MQLSCYTYLSTTPKTRCDIGPFRYTIDGRLTLLNPGQPGPRGVRGGAHNKKRFRPTLPLVAKALERRPFIACFLWEHVHRDVGCTTE